MVATEEASLEASFSNPYSACGFIGGIIFCVSILPQLIKTYRTKSAKDLSYFWQACYLLGLIGISIYGVAYKLWPVAIPLIIEIVFMGCIGSPGVDEALEGDVGGSGTVVIAADTDGVLEHRRYSGSKEPLDIVTTSELEMRRL
ncbi:unnamed protein product [Closterium sp. Naga37s-1]|nr:unnamed protein product [Closterium sp. Naga37s-1]